MSDEIILCPHKLFFSGTVSFKCKADKQTNKQTNDNERVKFPDLVFTRPWTRISGQTALVATLRASSESSMARCLEAHSGAVGVGSYTSAFVRRNGAPKASTWARCCACAGNGRRTGLGMRSAAEQCTFSQAVIFAQRFQKSYLCPSKA